MKILKHCLLLGTVLCMPMTVEAAATSEPVEIVRLQGQLPAPLSPTHIELFKLAESGDLDAKEIFFQRFMNGAVSFAFREKFDISKLLPQTDDLSLLSEAALYVASRAWKTIPDSFIKFIGGKALDGDTNAQGIMGFLYSNGKCVSQNHEEAASWYRQAIKSGNSGIAYNNLAYAIATKVVLPVSGEDCDDLSEKAMKNGFVGAIGVKKLMAQEVYLLQAAQAGRSEAERELGIRLIKEDRDKEAYPFLARAFDQGEDFTVEFLEYLAQEAKEAGEIDRAIALYEKSAELGSVKALGSLDVLYSNKRRHGDAYEAFMKQCNLLSFESIFKQSQIIKANAKGFLKLTMQQKLLALLHSDGDEKFQSLPYGAEEEMKEILNEISRPKIKVQKDEKDNKVGYFKHGNNGSLLLPLTNENEATLADLAKSLEQKATDGDALAAYRFGLFNAIGLFPDSTLSQALKYLKLADEANIPGAKRALAHLALRLSFLEKSRKQGHELLETAVEYAEIASDTCGASSSVMVEQAPIRREEIGELFRIARAAYSSETWPVSAYVSYSKTLSPLSDILEVQQAMLLLTAKRLGKTKGEKGQDLSFKSQLKQASKLFSKNNCEEAVESYTQILRTAFKSKSSLYWNPNFAKWIAIKDTFPGIKTDEYIEKVSVKMITQLLSECHLLGIGTPQNMDFAVMFAEQSHALFANISDAPAHQDDSSSDDSSSDSDY